MVPDGAARRSGGRGYRATVPVSISKDISSRTFRHERIPEMACRDRGRRAHGMKAPAAQRGPLRQSRAMSPHPATGTAEWRRLQEVPRGRAPWRHWGPHVSERAWGTVREDYSADADAWRFFPFDHARCRAYRWNEDGLGVCSRRLRTFTSLRPTGGASQGAEQRVSGAALSARCRVPVSAAPGRMSR